MSCLLFVAKRTAEGAVGSEGAATSSSMCDQEKERKRKKKEEERILPDEGGLEGNTF